MPGEAFGAHGLELSSSKRRASGIESASSSHNSAVLILVCLSHDGGLTVLAPSEQVVGVEESAALRAGLDPSGKPVLLYRVALLARASHGLLEPCLTDLATAGRSDSKLASLGGPDVVVRVPGADERVSNLVKHGGLGELEVSNLGPVTRHGDGLVAVAALAQAGLGRVPLEIPLVKPVQRHLGSSELLGALQSTDSRGAVGALVNGEISEVTVRHGTMVCRFH